MIYLSAMPIDSSARFMIVLTPSKQPPSHWINAAVFGLAMLVSAVFMKFLIKINIMYVIIF